MRPNRSGRNGLLGLALLAGIFSARACEDPQKGGGGRESRPERPRPWFQAAPPPQEFEPPDSDGNPATAGAQAIHGSVEADADAGPVEVFLLGDEGELAVTGGADGSFRFDSPPGGVRTVAAVADGRPVAMASARPGKALALVIGVAAPRIGRIVDADGTALSGIRVAARVRDAAGRVIAASRPACTDGKGFFALPDAPGGDIELVADAEGPARILAGAGQAAGGPGEPLRVVVPALPGDVPLVGCEPPRSRPESAGAPIPFP